MSERSPVRFTTIASRMIKVAKAQGLRVAGILPDGTIVTYDGDKNPLIDRLPPISKDADDESARWADQ